MSTEIQVDDETRAALLLFNERVESSAAQERGAKRVAKAERQKDEAAAVVRKMNDNSNASAEDKAEAEAAYKAAVENYQVIQANPEAGDPQPKKKAEAAAEAPAEQEVAETPAEEAPAEEASTEAPTTEAPAQEAAAEESPAEDSPPAEVSADDEPAPAAASSGESE